MGSRRQAQVATPPLAVVASAGLAAVALTAVFWLRGVELPPGALDPREVASTRVLDRHGTLAREVLSRHDGRAHWVPLARISPHLVAATIAAEDRRFYQHSGIDPWATLRAAVLNLGRGRVVSGASTLTMQLVGLLEQPGGSATRRGLVGKLRQAALAYRLERQLDKAQILWHYLNRAPYGHGTFGAEAAARRYLGKPAADLSLAEAALLAALPRAPSAYSPLRSRRSRARLRDRQRYLIGIMRAHAKITAEQARLALAQPIDFEQLERPFAAPHLVERLLADPLARGATAIQSTIDLQLQRRVETAVRQTITRLADRRVTNGAALVVDNRTREVLAYVGSADFFHRGHHGQVDGTLARRQPGSTIKPFTYALALERGKTPASLLEDLPAHFNTERGDYAPRNYDREFHGPVRLRVALASSYNVPAVRAAAFVGVGALLAHLRQAGMRALERGARHYGLGLTLGNGEVTLQQLVEAYVTLARGGEHQPLRLVRRVQRTDGRWYELPAGPAPRRVFSPTAAYLIADILADPLARVDGFGSDTPLAVGFPAAVKTGTSKDFRDNWTVGFTPDVTVGVWVGNFDGRPMQRVSGITGAGPLWAEVMVAAARRYPRHDRGFDRPRTIVSARICPLSGALVGPLCPAAIDERFAPDSEPRRRCTFHREVAIDTTNDLLAGERCSLPGIERRVMTVYPPIYRAWAARRAIEQPPTRGSPRCRPPATRSERPRTLVSGPAVRITSPVAGDTFYVDPDLRRRYQRLPLEAAVDGRAGEVRWLVDGRQVARAAFPFSASWPISRGRHTVQATLPDGTRSRPVKISVQ